MSFGLSGDMPKTCLAHCGANPQFADAHKAETCATGRQFLVPLRFLVISARRRFPPTNHFRAGDCPHIEQEEIALPPAPIAER